jgi:hypothetical protein
MGSTLEAVTLRYGEYLANLPNLHTTRNNREAQRGRDICAGRKLKDFPLQLHGKADFVSYAHSNQVPRVN